MNAEPPRGLRALSRTALGLYSLARRKGAAGADRVLRLVGAEGLAAVEAVAGSVGKPADAVTLDDVRHVMLAEARPAGPDWVPRLDLPAAPGKSLERAFEDYERTRQRLGRS